MDKFQELKQQIEAQNKPLTPQQKFANKLMHFEEDIRSFDFAHPFSVSLDQLSHEKGQTIGPHNYPLSIYSLEWTNLDKSFFGLYLTNQKANKTLPVQKIPDYLQEFIIKNIESFLEKYIEYTKVKND